MGRHRDLSQRPRLHRHPAPSYVVRTPPEYEFFDEAWLQNPRYPGLTLLSTSLHSDQWTQSLEAIAKSAAALGAALGPFIDAVGVVGLQAIEWRKQFEAAAQRPPSTRVSVPNPPPVRKPHPLDVVLVRPRDRR